MNLGAIVIIGYSFLVFICLVTIQLLERKNWNKGLCKCGGKWILSEQTNYTREYRCEECNKEIYIMSNIDRGWNV